MVSDKSWQEFSRADYNDEQWKRACLYCDTDCLKDSTPKQCCKLPVKEPDGTLNRNGIVAAYASMRGARGGVKGIPDEKRSEIMNKLRNLYRKADLDLPEELKANTNIKVHGTIWDVGEHNLWIKNKKTDTIKPATLKVTARSLKRDYDLLKESLPIPIGIDHLPDNIINKYPILKQLDLLNVGEIRDVKLTDDGIKIKDAELYDNKIRELYSNGSLTDFSIISDVYTKESDNPDVDYIEDFSLIKRVDFVDKGACETCKVEPAPAFLNAKISYDNKNKVGEIMTDKMDRQVDGKQELEAKEYVKGLEAELAELRKELEELREAGDAEEEEDKEEAGEGEAKADNTELEKLKEDIIEIKAEKQEMEAKTAVKTFLKDGKILPKHIHKHESIAMKNLEDYKELMADAPKVLDYDKQSEDLEDEKEDEDPFKEYNEFMKKFEQ